LRLCGKKYRQMNLQHLYILSLLIFMLSCNNTPENIKATNSYPNIYPDYINVTIPENIAPLNFMIRGDSCEKMKATIIGKQQSITIKGKNKIQIPIKKWKKVLLKEKQQLSITVSAKINGHWKQYKTFVWNVKPNKIDAYLSYRLIEPGYEVWNKLQLVERNVETFEEHVLADNNLVDNSCMNCHIYANNNPHISFFHLRGTKGGTVLNRNGKLRKIITRTPKMIANATYGNLHPSGRYGVFSTNIVIPEFHSFKNKRLEVYDRASNLVVIDFDTNKAFSQPFLSDTANYETFPVFSVDGKWIYYCSAPAKPVPDSIRALRYSILKIAFNPDSATIGTKSDTVWNANKHNASACHLKTSPDGKYLLYTISDYGTFPIWHREADLQMLNLETQEINKLTNVNDTCSDSYHCWSSNSRWFVFASKRDNGIYGKPYFAYIDKNGQASKPFVLPQRDPASYNFMLKSFNIPELSTGRVPFNARDIEKLYKGMDAEHIK